VQCISILACANNSRAAGGVFHENWSILPKTARVRHQHRASKVHYSAQHRNRHWRPGAATRLPRISLRPAFMRHHTQPLAPNVFVRCSCLAAESKVCKAAAALLLPRHVFPTQAVEISWNFRHPSLAQQHPLLPPPGTHLKTNVNSSGLLIMNPFSTHHRHKRELTTPPRTSVYMYYPQKYRQEATTSKSHPFFVCTYATLRIPSSSEQPQHHLTAGPFSSPRVHLLHKVTSRLRCRLPRQEYSRAQVYPRVQHKAPSVHGRLNASTREG
jgi:hypothetical protein